MTAGQAQGKVILLGEHAVVYGHPALCGALRDGVTVEAVPGEGLLSVPAWGKRIAAGAQGDALGQAYGAILRSLALSGRPLHHDFVVRFAIPTSAGLGSSAALAVALARTLDSVLGLGLAAGAVAEAALAAETVFHGRPSGLDHTVAQHGGFGLFRREQGLSPLPASSLPLCIGLTGRARDTRGRVERVAELYRQDPDGMQGRFAAIAALVQRGAKAVTEGDLAALGEAMNRNQQELRHLEVSCPEIESMCRIATDAGALGAKLTGGGGGGCVIAVAPGREAQVQEAWRRAGFASFVTSVGGRPS